MQRSGSARALWETVASLGGAFHSAYYVVIPASLLMALAMIVSFRISAILHTWHKLELENFLLSDVSFQGGPDGTQRLTVVGGLRGLCCPAMLELNEIRGTLGHSGNQHVLRFSAEDIKLRKRDPLQATAVFNFERPDAFLVTDLAKLPSSGAELRLSFFLRMRFCYFRFTCRQLQIKRRFDLPLYSTASGEDSLSLEQLASMVRLSFSPGSVSKKSEAVPDALRSAGVGYFDHIQHGLLRVPEEHPVVRVELHFGKFVEALRKKNRQLSECEFSLRVGSSVWNTGYRAFPSVALSSFDSRRSDALAFDLSLGACDGAFQSSLVDVVRSAYEEYEQEKQGDRKVSEGKTAGRQKPDCDVGHRGCLFGGWHVALSDVSVGDDVVGELSLRHPRYVPLFSALRGALSASVLQAFVLSRAGCTGRLSLSLSPFNPKRERLSLVAKNRTELTPIYVLPEGDQKDDKDGFFSRDASQGGAAKGNDVLKLFFRLDGLSPSIAQAISERDLMLLFYAPDGVFSALNGLHLSLFSSSNVLALSYGRNAFSLSNVIPVSSSGSHSPLFSRLCIRHLIKDSAFSKVEGDRGKGPGSRSHGGFGPSKDKSSCRFISSIQGSDSSETAGASASSSSDSLVAELRLATTSPLPLFSANSESWKASAFLSALAGGKTAVGIESCGCSTMDGLCCGAVLQNARRFVLSLTSAVARSFCVETDLTFLGDEDFLSFKSFLSFLASATIQPYVLGMAPFRLQNRTFYQMAGNETSGPDSVSGDTLHLARAAWASHELFIASIERDNGATGDKARYSQTSGKGGGKAWIEAKERFGSTVGRAVLIDFVKQVELILGHRAASIGCASCAETAAVPHFTVQRPSNTVQILSKYDGDRTNTGGDSSEGEDKDADGPIAFPPLKVSMLGLARLVVPSKAKGSAKKSGRRRGGFYGLSGLYNLLHANDSSLLKMKEVGSVESLGVAFKIGSSPEELRKYNARDYSAVHEFCFDQLFLSVPASACELSAVSPRMFLALPSAPNQKPLLTLPEFTAVFSPTKARSGDTRRVTAGTNSGSGNTGSEDTLSLPNAVLRDLLSVKSETEDKEDSVGSSDRGGVVVDGTKASVGLFPKLHEDGRFSCEISYKVPRILYHDVSRFIELETNGVTVRAACGSSEVTLRLSKEESCNCEIAREECDGKRKSLGRKTSKTNQNAERSTRYVFSRHCLKGEEKCSVCGPILTKEASAMSEDCKEHDCCKTCGFCCAPGRDKRLRKLRTKENGGKGNVVEYEVHKHHERHTQAKAIPSAGQSGTRGVQPGIPNRAAQCRFCELRCHVYHCPKVISVLTSCSTQVSLRQLLPASHPSPPGRCSVCEDDNKCKKYYADHGIRVERELYHQSKSASSQSRTRKRMFRTRAKASRRGSKKSDATKATSSAMSSAVTLKCRLDVNVAVESGASWFESCVQGLVDGVPDFVRFNSLLEKAGQEEVNLEVSSSNSKKTDCKIPLGYIGSSVLGMVEDGRPLSFLKTLPLVRRLLGQLDPSDWKDISIQATDSLVPVRGSQADLDALVDALENLLETVFFGREVPDKLAALLKHHSVADYTYSLIRLVLSVATSRGSVSELIDVVMGKPSSTKASSVSETSASSAAKDDKVFSVSLSEHVDDRPQLKLDLVDISSNEGALSLRSAVYGKPIEDFFGALVGCFPSLFFVRSPSEISFVFRLEMDRLAEVKVRDAPLVSVSGATLEYSGTFAATEYVVSGSVSDCYFDTSEDADLCPPSTTVTVEYEPLSSARNVITSSLSYEVPVAKYAHCGDNFDFLLHLEACKRVLSNAKGSSCVFCSQLSIQRSFYEMQLGLMGDMQRRLVSGHRTPKISVHQRLAKGTKRGLILSKDRAADVRLLPQEEEENQEDEVKTAGSGAGTQHTEQPDADADKTVQDNSKGKAAEDPRLQGFRDNILASISKAEKFIEEVGSEGKSSEKKKIKKKKRSLTQPTFFYERVDERDCDGSKPVYYLDLGLKVYFSENLPELLSDAVLGLVGSDNCFSSSASSKKVQSSGDSGVATDDDDDDGIFDDSRYFNVGNTKHNKKSMAKETDDSRVIGQGCSSDSLFYVSYVGDSLLRLKRDIITVHRAKKLVSVFSRAFPGALPDLSPLKFVEPAFHSKNLRLRIHNDGFAALDLALPFCVSLARGQSISLSAPLLSNVYIVTRLSGSLQDVEAPKYAVTIPIRLSVGAVLYKERRVEQQQSGFLDSSSEDEEGFSSSDVAGTFFSDNGTLSSAHSGLDAGRGERKNRHNSTDSGLGSDAESVRDSGGESDASKGSKAEKKTSSGVSASTNENSSSSASLDAAKDLKANASDKVIASGDTSSVKFEFYVDDTEDCLTARPLRSTSAPFGLFVTERQNSFCIASNRVLIDIPFFDAFASLLGFVTRSRLLAPLIEPFNRFSGPGTFFFSSHPRMRDVSRLDQVVTCLCFGTHPSAVAHSTYSSSCSLSYDSPLGWLRFEGTDPPSFYQLSVLDNSFTHSVISRSQDFFDVRHISLEDDVAIWCFAFLRTFTTFFDTSSRKSNTCNCRAEIDRLKIFLSTNQGKANDGNVTPKPDVAVSSSKQERPVLVSVVGEKRAKALTIADYACYWASRHFRGNPAADLRMEAFYTLFKDIPLKYRYIDCPVHNPYYRKQPLLKAFNARLLRAASKRKYPQIVPEFVGTFFAFSSYIRNAFGTMFSSKRARFLRNMISKLHNSEMGLVDVVNQEYPFLIETASRAMAWIRDSVYPFVAGLLEKYDIAMDSFVKPIIEFMKLITSIKNGAKNGWWFFNACLSGCGNAVVGVFKHVFSKKKAEEISGKVKGWWEQFKGRLSKACKRTGFGASEGKGTTVPNTVNGEGDVAVDSAGLFYCRAVKYVVEETLDVFYSMLVHLRLVSDPESSSEQPPVAPEKQKDAKKITKQNADPEDVQKIMDDVTQLVAGSNSSKYGKISFSKLKESTKNVVSSNVKSCYKSAVAMKDSVVSAVSPLFSRAYDIVFRPKEMNMAYRNQQLFEVSLDYEVPRQTVMEFLKDLRVVSESAGKAIDRVVIKDIMIGLRSLTDSALDVLSREKQSNVLQNLIVFQKKYEDVKFGFLAGVDVSSEIFLFKLLLKHDDEAEKGDDSHIQVVSGSTGAGQKGGILSCETNCPPGTESGAEESAVACDAVPVVVDEKPPAEEPSLLTTIANYFLSWLSCCCGYGQSQRNASAAANRSSFWISSSDDGSAEHHPKDIVVKEECVTRSSESCSSSACIGGDFHARSADSDMTSTSADDQSSSTKGGSNDRDCGKQGLGGEVIIVDTEKDVVAVDGDGGKKDASKDLKSKDDPSAKSEVLDNNAHSDASVDGNADALSQTVVAEKADVEASSSLSKTNDGVDQGAGVVGDNMVSGSQVSDRKKQVDDGSVSHHHDHLGEVSVEDGAVSGDESADTVVPEGTKVADVGELGSSTRHSDNDSVISRDSVAGLDSCESHSVRFSVDDSETQSVPSASSIPSCDVLVGCQKNAVRETEIPIETGFVGDSGAIDLCSSPEGCDSKQHTGKDKNGKEGVLLSVRGPSGGNAPSKSLVADGSEKNGSLDDDCNKMGYHESHTEHHTMAKERNIAHLNVNSSNIEHSNPDKNKQKEREHHGADVVSARRRSVRATH